MADPHFAIFQIKPQFEQFLDCHHLVIESDTGSGKSTYLPIWTAQLGKRILVIEPRRLACVALAQYLASQHQDIKVGHAIRFYSDIDPQTQIAFVTPGVALRWFTENQLADFDVIMIDEFHERRWDTDLLLAIFKQHNQHRLIVTSATINSDLIQAYLGADSRRLKAIGKQFSVQLHYLADTSHQLADNFKIDQKVRQAVIQVIESIKLQQIKHGAILVFLAGKSELNSCQALLSSLGIEILLLHGGSSVDVQQAVLTPVEHIRIILATNVAETSVTIADVIAVIDSGLERRTAQRNGRSVLSLTRISKASAMQRLGRAGRTQMGICIRLWGEYAVMETCTPPEMQREELTEAMLAAASAGYDFTRLDFMEPLPEKSLTIAKNQLIKMAAIDENHQITTHGRQLFPLPIDSQFAHLISAMQTPLQQQLMVDLAAALTIGSHWFTLPRDPEQLTELLQWLPIRCDALTMVKLVRAQMSDLIVCDTILLDEIRQISEQIRQALALPALANSECIDAEFIKQYRLDWLQQVITTLPELAFIRRLKRNQTFANGLIELQQGRQSYLLASAQAAVVFDTFSLAAKGTKQAMTLATCMAEIPLSLLVENEIGQLQPPQLMIDDNGLPQMMIERHYAGRVIACEIAAAKATDTITAIVTSIIQNQLFKGCAAKIAETIKSYQLWLALPNNAKGIDPLFLQDVECENCPDNTQDYLATKLERLGIESYQDLELIDEQDLLFQPLADWLWQPFKELYPSQLILPDLHLQVGYQLSCKKVMLSYYSGARKTDPKRWELPSWQGWRIQYQKASRVIDIK